MTDENTTATPTGAGTAGPVGLDLTPRSGAAAPSTRRGRSWRNIAIIGGLGVVMVVILTQALTQARVYFYNVDEAIARRDELGDDVFRMQGTVVDTDGSDPTGALVFTIAFGDDRAEVRHIGDEPSSLFDLGQPVVVEGNWDGAQFRSTQIMVKHSEAYIEDNPDRVDYDVDDPVGDQAATSS